MHKTTIECLRLLSATCGMQVIKANVRVPARRITEGQDLPAMHSHFGLVSSAWRHADLQTVFPASPENALNHYVNHAGHRGGLPGAN